MTDTQPVKGKRIVDTFVYLDMDRTLLDSNAKIRMQCDLLRSHGVPSEQVDQALQAVLESKGSGLAEEPYLRQRFGEAVMDAVNHDLKTKVLTDMMFQNRLLYNGATKRIFKALRSHAVGFGIVTKGEQANQRVKLALLRAGTDESDQSVPAIVVTNDGKARQAEMLIDQDGTIPILKELTANDSVATKHLIIIDDKLENLTVEHSSTIRGIHIGTSEQEGQLTLANLADRLEAGEDIMTIAAMYQA